MSGFIFGMDLAPNLSRSVFVKQYIRPDGSIQFISEEPFMPTDWIKQNRYAIITIMMKTIAEDLRNKYTDLHVEAHPRPGPNSVRLNVRRIETDESVIIDVRPGAPMGTPSRIAQQMQDSNHYVASVELFNKNKVARKKGPSACTFVLDDPRGTISFEIWIDSIIAEWFYAESSEKQQTKPVGNTNGPATP